MQLQDIFQRVVRANRVQDVKGKCIICTKPFSDCPHTLNAVQSFIALYDIYSKVSIVTDYKD
jgi:hypothetical protein